MQWSQVYLKEKILQERERYPNRKRMRKNREMVLFMDSRLIELVRPLHSFTLCVFSDIVATGFPNNRHGEGDEKQFGNCTSVVTHGGCFKTPSNQSNRYDGRNEMRSTDPSPLASLRFLRSFLSCYTQNRVE